MMRAAFTLLFATLAALAPAAGHAQRPARQAQPAAASGAIRIVNPAGSVTVTGWDRDSIAVESAGPGKPELYVSGANAKVGFWGGDEDTAPAVALEVRVPAGSRVWVKTVTADVIVRAVGGGVDVSSVSGRIEVRGSPAEAYLESMGGAVVAEVETRLLRARTAGGDIEVRGRVMDAQVYTVSGRVDVVNKEVERGRFESVDGGIRYRGGVGRASSVEFVTHSGPIDIALPAGIDADIRISSFQGEVDNQLGGRMETVGGKLRSREAQLTLGRGGRELIVRTFKGAVTLRKL